MHSHPHSDLQRLQSPLHFIHANFVAGGHKRNRYRDAQLWQYDDASYYSVDRLLSFDLHTPAAPEKWQSLPTRARVRFHVHSMAMQLEQVRGEPLPGNSQ